MLYTNIIYIIHLFNVQYIYIYAVLYNLTPLLPRTFKLKFFASLKDAYDAQHQVPAGRRNGQPYKL